MLPDAPDAVVADGPDQLDECQRALLTLGGVRWLVEDGVERSCEGAAALLVAAEAERDMRGVVSMRGAAAT